MRLLVHGLAAIGGLAVVWLAWTIVRVYAERADERDRYERMY